MKCINTNAAEFQTLLKQSGLPDFYLAAFCGKFLDTRGRFPYLDEVPGSDSTKYLTSQLDIKNHTTSIQKVLEMTGKETLEEAQIELNHIFRDVEVEITPITDTTARIYITKRPINRELEKNIDHSPYVTSGLLFEEILHKLQTLNGIQINAVDSEMIQDSELKDIPGIATAKAFVYNGEIYVNTDLSDKDAPIHEMMHIMMGGLRRDDPELYFSIASQIADQPFFEEYKAKYPNRTRSDVAEEAFVSEFAKLASFGTSGLSALDDATKYELFYNAKRVLDSMVMGQCSVQKIADTKLFNSSLIEICDMVGSEIDATKLRGQWALDNIHRSLANKKQELMENKELEEDCG